MNGFKRILCLLFIGFLSINLLAQKTFSLDSLLQSVQNQSDDKLKVIMLQKSIKEIYLTKFDETIVLAQFGYNLANKRNDNINKGDFLRTIGGAFVKKGKVDSASVYYYKALKQLELTKNSEKLGLLYDDMARLYRKLKQPKRALDFYNRALSLYVAENNLEGIARINNESGVVFRDGGDYKSANERFEKSLRIQKQRNDSIGIGYSLEFLGYNQLLLKNYKKAEMYLNQALTIREKLSDDFALMLNYTALGEYYKAINDFQESIVFFQKSNTVAKKIKFLDIQLYNYGQIMSNYEATGNFKDAYKNLKYFNVLNDSLYSVKKLKDVEEITTKYETVEKEKEIAEKELLLKIRNLWIFGLTVLVGVIGMIGFLVYKQQVIKNIQQRKDDELKLALEKIDSQNRLQEQRLSISRDLHDNIGAQLAFIISAIDTMKYYSSNNGEELNELHVRLENIGAFAKGTIQELRDTVWAMNKSNITLKDLKSRINNFIEKAKQSHHMILISIIVDKNVPADLTFTGLQGLNIFRIVQESISNALKYAKADQIEIHINITEFNIQFIIKDNGNGFQETEIEPGNGLLNMRKRALELGDKLVLTSINGVGTSVSFYINKEK